MISLTSPFLWAAGIVVIGTALLFSLGARRVALRFGGRSEALDAPRGLSLPAPIAGGMSLRKVLIRLGVVTLLGVGVGVVLLRFVNGLGAVTNLSDQFPWGLWISFDVMCGVALAAGAFVIAGSVHVFGLERYEPLVRPAILTGLLGYLLVVAGLVVDLGRPYNVWRPLFSFQHRSVLWEVGVCVALYTTVLLIEFLPVALERINQSPRIVKRLPTVSLHRFLKRISIVFVILGVILSTLHQSSLGSLWVLLPTKLHPLWYSLYLPVLFWISAVAVGLAMVIMESTLSSKAFGRGLETDLLASLGKAAAVVLAVYLAAKFIDLATRQALPFLFEPTLQSAAFWLEIGLGVIVPMVILAVPRWRRKPALLFVAATLVIVFGVVLNRFNVSLIGLLPYTGNIYRPTWMEVVVTLSLVTAGVLAFWLAARFLPVFHEEHEAKPTA